MEPLLVSTREGFKALGIGQTKGYDLIKTGELEAVKIGKATRLTIKSIHAYVDKHSAKREAA